MTGMVEAMATEARYKNWCQRMPKLEDLEDTLSATVG